MFAKLINAINLARAGAKAAADVQKKLDAVMHADGVIKDGHPDVENLKALLLEMRADGLKLVDKAKQCVAIIHGLVMAAQDA